MPRVPRALGVDVAAGGDLFIRGVRCHDEQLLSTLALFAHWPRRETLVADGPRRDFLVADWLDVTTYFSGEHEEGERADQLSPVGRCAGRY